MSDFKRPRHALHLIWNVTLVLLVYACGLLFVQIWTRPLLFRHWDRLDAIGIGDPNNPAVVEYTEPEVVGGIENPIKVKYAALPGPVKLNRYANAYNRPESTVERRDDYLAPRPHVDTEINFEALMLGCRGDLERLDRYKNTSNCLHFLKEHAEAYTTIPPKGSRASDRDPRLAEYLNSDGRDNTMDSYVSAANAQPTANSSRGTCPGPIIPYHVYWRGPATWRVEIFIKSYLYTQNLACSQLNLWLDSDPFPNAVTDMLYNDPLFARFRSLVDRGDIAVRPWHFPSRIPLSDAKDSQQKRDQENNIVASRDEGDRGILSRFLNRRTHASDEVVLSQKQKTFLPVAVSDAVRFIVLHLYGGGYFDMDVIMLRDMRPFYLPKNHSFAERWSTYTNGGFNTAIMSLTANSSLSAYLLQGAIKMGFNFHPLILGIMSSKQGRNRELQMMEHGLFDPLWTRYAEDEEGPCPVPCFQGDYSKAFKSGPGRIKGEWRSYAGPQLKHLPVGQKRYSKWETGLRGKTHEDNTNEMVSGPKPLPSGIIFPDSSDHLHTSRRRSPDMRSHGSVSDDFLIHANIIADYSKKQDKWPPTNRTLENFFRGAYTYHIHNQWDARPEPSSWLNVIERAHNRFFAGESPNPYGEMWQGPSLSAYSTWVEFL